MRYFSAASKETKVLACQALLIDKHGLDNVNLDWYIGELASSAEEALLVLNADRAQ